MDCACVLATALLLGSLPASLPGPSQDTSGGSNAAAQAPSSQAPSSAPAGDAQTPPANRQPPAGQEGSTKGQAAKKGPARPATTKKPARKHASPPAPGEPRRLVVREGGADEPTVQLSPGMSREQASHQRQKTEQLLDATENNLRQLAGRALNQNQQDTIAQIRNYMAGARSALKDGDPQGARTLALKARLLSDELVKGVRVVPSQKFVDEFWGSDGVKARNRGG